MLCIEAFIAKKFKRYTLFSIMACKSFLYYVWHTWHVTQFGNSRPCRTQLLVMERQCTALHQLQLCSIDAWKDAFPVKCLGQSQLLPAVLEPTPLSPAFQTLRQVYHPVVYTLCSPILFASSCFLCDDWKHERLSLIARAHHVLAPPQHLEASHALVVKAHRPHYRYRTDYLCTVVGA